MSKTFELSTVGAKVAYAVATTAGTRPYKGYIELLGITAAPEIDLSTTTHDKQPQRKLIDISP